MASIGLVAGLVAIVAVPAVLSAALPGERPVRTGDRLDVGFGVSVRPPPDARHDAAKSRPGSGEVLLRFGGLRLRLRAAAVRERPGDFLRHARAKLARDEGLRVGPAAPVRTAAGVPGERADLSVENEVFGEKPGCYAGFTAESAGVVAVITPVASCAEVPPSVWQAVTDLRFSRPEQW